MKKLIYYLVLTSLPLLAMESGDNSSDECYQERACARRSSVSNDIVCAGHSTATDDASTDKGEGDLSWRPDIVGLKEAARLYRIRARVQSEKPAFLVSRHDFAELFVQASVNRARNEPLFNELLQRVRTRATPEVFDNLPVELTGYELYCLLLPLQDIHDAQFDIPRRYHLTLKDLRKQATLNIVAQYVLREKEKADKARSQADSEVANHSLELTNNWDFEPVWDFPVTEEKTDDKEKERKKPGTSEKPQVMWSEALVYRHLEPDEITAYQITLQGYKDDVVYQADDLVRHANVINACRKLVMQTTVNY